MSAFETIGQPPPAPTTRVEVTVNRRHGVIAALCCLVIAGGAYWEGRQDGSARYDAEHARFEAYRTDEAVTRTNEQNRQAAARKAIQADADRRVDDAKADAARSKEDMDAYLAELARRPASDRCSLTDADLRGLRVGAARSHRRPAQPPRGPEVVR